MTPENAVAVAVSWGMDALDRAVQRATEASSAKPRRAAEAWASAVEGVWWAISLDEQFTRQLDDAYASARNSDPDGRVLQGIRWLRHRQAHELVPTGSGGPAKDFFKPTGFYITPILRWRMRSDIHVTETKGRVKNAQWRAYGEHVEGQPLTRPLERASRWFRGTYDHVGWDPKFPADPTAL